MEIEGEDGSRIELEGESKAVFGRGNGFNAKDRTVSRQHVQFQLQRAGPQPESTALFEVVGKNPIWVRRVGGETGDEVKIFRKLERGEVAAGDWFCVSSRDPVWFKVEKKRIGRPEAYYFRNNKK
uniref:FHA domain-containing protein n=1 Tax=Rhizophora mucronata TaxID=61149 RepID=A0A2P2R1U3_RHIMU